MDAALTLVLWAGGVLLSLYVLAALVALVGLVVAIFKD